jgi:hypothetical protein
MMCTNHTNWNILFMYNIHYDSYEICRLMYYALIGFVYVYSNCRLVCNYWIFVYCFVVLLEDKSVCMNEKL